MSNWKSLKTFENFDPTSDLNKPLTEDKKDISGFRKMFEAVQVLKLSKKEMRKMGIEHGRAFAEAGNKYEDAKVYSETHDMCYIDGFKSAFGQSKVGETGWITKVTKGSPEIRI